jgi:sugar phosphate isomerase/epimerase
MITRRDFVKGCGAILLATPHAPAAKAKFTLGVGTYTYRGVTIDQMIERLATLDIRHVELSTPEFMLARLKPEEVPGLKAKFDRARIQVLSYYSGTIKAEIDLDRAIQTARALGARHISGAAMGVMLKQVDARVRREKLTFGLHNHWFRDRKFEYQSADDLLRALDGLSGAVGVTLDAGHMASCGYDPVEALSKLKGHLKAVHLKDVARAGDDRNVVLGTGVAKSAAVIEELKRQRYSGLVAIEFEEGTDPHADVARCVEFARRRM